jgi:hypothetical protein
MEVQGQANHSIQQTSSKDRDNLYINLDLEPTSQPPKQSKHNP